MQKHKTVRGIIFDMDNTLLKSRIDFKAMKLEIFQYLVNRNAVPRDLPIEQHTTATIIEHAKGLQLTAEMESEVWAIASKHELSGMKDADLESGVRDFLASVHQRFSLAVVTNNAFSAAREALELTGISHYFDLIVGREQMSALKPSPSGFLYVLKQFANIPAGQWISVGDSWIDGKASNQAGVPFVCYQTDEAVMSGRDVQTVGRIDEMQELSKYLDFS
jgi:phosphoglycolate phosphatase